MPPHLIWSVLSFTFHLLHPVRLVLTSSRQGASVSLAHGLSLPIATAYTYLQPRTHTLTGAPKPSTPPLRTQTTATAQSQCTSLLHTHVSVDVKNMTLLDGSTAGAPSTAPVAAQLQYTLPAR